MEGKQIIGHVFFRKKVILRLNEYNVKILNV